VGTKGYPKTLYIKEFLDVVLVIFVFLVMIEKRSVKG
jgi:hypothetical protein